MNGGLDLMKITNKLFIIQPSFLPWYGQIAMMLSSNQTVLLDDVQYDKNGWRNRNRVQNKNGEYWLTVPVITKNKSNQMNNQVVIASQRDWVPKTLRSIENSYGDAPYFATLFNELKKIFELRHTNLIELNLQTLLLIHEYLGVNFNYALSSTLKLPVDKNLRIIQACKTLNAKVYLSGQAAKTYIDLTEFANSGIEIEWFEERINDIFREIYPDFEKKLSVVDMLFKLGPEISKMLLLSLTEKEVGNV